MFYEGQEISSKVRRSFNTLKNHIIFIFAVKPSLHIVINVLKSLLLIFLPIFIRIPLFQKLTHEYFTIKLKDYQLFTNVPSIHLASEIYLGEEHEAYQEFRLQKGIIVVDVGAHYGFYSIKAASLGALKVIAIEPHPQNFQILSYNKHQNNATNVILYNIALSDSEKQLKFYVGPSSTSGTIVEEQVNNHPIDFDGEYLTVKTRTLDSILAEERISPTIIKIDVEGAELQVLHGAINCLKSSQVKLVVECHSALLTQQVRHFLIACGFQKIAGKKRIGGYILYASK